MLLRYTSRQVLDSTPLHALLLGTKFECTRGFIFTKQPDSEQL